MIKSSMLLTLLTKAHSPRHLPMSYLFNLSKIPTFLNVKSEGGRKLMVPVIIVLVLTYFFGANILAGLKFNRPKF